MSDLWVEAWKRISEQHNIFQSYVSLAPKFLESQLVNFLAHYRLAGIIPKKDEIETDIFQLSQSVYKQYPNYILRVRPQDVFITFDIQFFGGTARFFSHGRNWFEIHDGRTNKDIQANNFEELCNALPAVSRDVLSLMVKEVMPGAFEKWEYGVGRFLCEALLHQKNEYSDFVRAFDFQWFYRSMTYERIAKHMTIIHDELSSIMKDLYATKSFIKSEALQALRERSEKLIEYIEKTAVQF